MAIPPQNGTVYRLGEVERRMTEIEKKTDGLGALVQRVGDMDEDFKSLRRTLNIFIGALIIGSVGFAFTTFELLGKG